MWDSEFTLDVTFTLQHRFADTTLADITFATVYEPPREKYDFPLRTGDQWVSSYESGTNVTGSSTISTQRFDTPYIEDNTTYQVTTDGEPAKMARRGLHWLL